VALRPPRGDTADACAHTNTSHRRRSPSLGATPSLIKANAAAVTPLQTRHLHAGWLPINREVGYQTAVACPCSSSRARRDQRANGPQIANVKPRFSFGWLSGVSPAASRSPCWLRKNVSPSGLKQPPQNSELLRTVLAKS
jgi:hypothetical protein